MLKKMLADYRLGMSEDEMISKYLRESKNMEAVKNSDEYISFSKKRKRIGFCIITIYDISYPDKLRYSIDPPMAFYYIGDESLLSGFLTGAVGSREAPEVYIKKALNLGKGLNKLQLNGISGLARGIDASFHKGCNKSIGVLGCGIDQVYPRENHELYIKVIESGGILSEYPLESKPLKWHFPRRNRIIAGLADILVVVYANTRSGSIITLDYMLELNREIFLTNLMHERLDLAGHKISKLKKYLNNYLEQRQRD